MSHERRIFVDQLQSHTKSFSFEIFGDNLKHLKTVLRLKEGDPVVVVDKSTMKSFDCFVSSSKDPFTLNISNSIEESEYNSVVRCLVLGLCKQPTTEIIIEKATELGVSNIHLVQSQRSVVKIEKDRKSIDSKFQRFNKVAESAAKQSSRNSIPEISIFSDFNDWMNQGRGEDTVFYGSLEEDALKLALAYQNAFQTDSADLNRISVLIGPEGDFSSSEFLLFKTNGFTPFSLGGNRLRSETAAIAAISGFDAVRTF